MIGEILQRPCSGLRGDAVLFKGVSAEHVHSMTTRVRASENSPALNPLLDQLQMTVLLTVLFQIKMTKPSIHAGYSVKWGSGLGTIR